MHRERGQDRGYGGGWRALRGGAFLGVTVVFVWLAQPAACSKAPEPDRIELRVQDYDRFRYLPMESTGRVEDRYRLPGNRPPIDPAYARLEVVQGRRKAVTYSLPGAPPRLQELHRYLVDPARRFPDEARPAIT